MKIFMLSAEAFPFAKTGGLADAVSSLSKTLSSSGDEVKILIPRYYSIPREKLSLCIKNLAVDAGFCKAEADFYKTNIGNGTEIFFLDYEPFFGRDGFYGPSADSEYPDNCQRFSFFAASLFSLCGKIGFSPDIIHFHDWSSSLAAPLLKFRFRENPLFRKTKSVMTIHNAGYQGKFPSGSFSLAGIPQEFRSESGIDDGGNINFLKAGITCADKITTVSPNYAKEIQTDGQGFGLSGLYRVRKDDIFGIVNGIDTSVWNPSSDMKIPFRFSVSSLSGKKKCKKELQKYFGLPENPDVPVISMITRLASQKGIDEVFAPMYGSLWRICTELDVQFVVLGSGEKWCEKEIRILSEKLPNFKAFIGYNDALSHLIEAGSDLFLMPSRYEPCGLNQIYSMLYGTLPVVRNTGGLHDTVENYDQSSAEGTGFVFDDLTPDAVFGTLKWAVETYRERPEHFRKLVKNAMSQNFSWEKSAEEYRKVYRNALS